MPAEENKQVQPPVFEGPQAAFDNIKFLENMPRENFDLWMKDVRNADKEQADALYKEYQDLLKKSKETLKPINDDLQKGLEEVIKMPKDKQEKVLTKIMAAQEGMMSYLTFQIYPTMEFGYSTTLKTIRANLDDPKPYPSNATLLHPDLVKSAIQLTDGENAARLLKKFDEIEKTELNVIKKMQEHKDNYNKAVDKEEKEKIFKTASEFAIKNYKELFGRIQPYLVEIIDALRQAVKNIVNEGNKKSA